MAQLLAEGSTGMVGRGGELLRLLTWVEGPGRATYVVAGSAGVGKSRLVTEAARATGRRTRAGAPTGGTPG